MTKPEYFSNCPCQLSSHMPLAVGCRGGGGANVNQISLSNLEFVYIAMPRLKESERTTLASLMIVTMDPDSEGG